MPRTANWPLKLALAFAIAGAVWAGAASLALGALLERVHANAVTSAVARP